MRRVASLLPAFALLEVATVLSLYWLSFIVSRFPAGVDLDIPLRAAQRWIAGQPPYLAAASSAASGHDLPFLYPPYVLPIVAPLLALPRPVVLALWDMTCGLVALVALDRLAVPRRWWPAFLIWPPFTEPIWNGNIQVVLFAAYAIAFWRTRGPEDWRPLARSPDPTGLGARSGLMATFVGAVKASQVHAWLLCARWDRRGAAIGASTLLVIAALTLPLTGVGLYRDWLDQAARAANPAGDALGWPLVQYLPPPWPVAVIVGSLLAVLFLPKRDAAVWTGMLLVLGSPSVHEFSWLLCVPAMLRIRREAALLVALAWATYQPQIEWAAFAFLAGCLLASYRVPGLTAEPQLGSRSSSVAASSTT